MTYNNSGTYSPAQIGMTAQVAGTSQVGFFNALDVSGTTVMAVPGYFDNLNINLSQSVTTPDTVITLAVNGSPTDLSCDCVNGSVETQDITHTVWVNANDEVTLVLVGTGDTGNFASSIRFTQTGAGY